MPLIFGADFTVSALKIYFLHPQTKKEICIILDPCQVIKLLRNAVGNWRGFSYSGKQILWSFSVELVNLQENEGLHLATKIRRRHVDCRNEKSEVDRRSKTSTVQRFRSNNNCLLDWGQIT